MKIGYDAKRAFLNTTGLGNYSRWLIKSLAEHHPGNRYYLYTPKTRPGSALALLKALRGVAIRLPGNKFFTSWWRTKTVVNDLRRDAVQLYHGLSHELPLSIAGSGIRSIVTVHDLITLRFPEYFSWINRRIYVAKLKHACSTAGCIIAISEQTKTDLIRLLNIDAAKIRVIYQGCDPAFGIRADAAQQQHVRQKYQLPARYLLTVGTIEERKNLLLIVKALRQVPEIQLVVTGRATRYVNKVNDYLQQHQLNHRVLFLHQVPFADLPALYQMATVFIYPSRYEGFGLPVLEALNAGIPVIAATGSCLEEAGGPDSIYVDPDNEAALTAQISHLLSNAGLRQQMSAAGQTYAAGFSDKILTGQIIDLYRQTLQQNA